MDRTEARLPFETERHVLDLGRALGAPADACDREAILYARYVRALVMLCECAPYVDDEGYADRLDELIRDASSNYPLDWRRCGESIDIAPRVFDEDR